MTRLTTNLLDPAALAALNGERDVVAAVRTPQEHPWVVGVVASRPGVGATTTALGTATVLAALRDDGVAVAGIRAADARLTTPIGHPPTRRLSDLGASVPGDVPTAAGVLVVGGPAAGHPMLDAELHNAVDVLTFGHRYLLFDIGDDRSDVGQAALACVDAVVLVTDSADQVDPALDRILRAAPGVGGTTAAAIVGGRGVDRHRTVERLRGFDVTADRVVEVPGGPVRTATRVAYLQLAALLGAATRS
ncbi:hypothetical protein GCM10009557_86830 [Virgisporangium ochraceum]